MTQLAVFACYCISSKNWRLRCMPRKRQPPTGPVDWSQLQQWHGHSYLIAWQTTMTDLKRVFVEGKNIACLYIFIASHFHASSDVNRTLWTWLKTSFWPCESEEGTRSFDQCPKTICNLPWCKPARVHSISRSTARYHKVKQANLGINTGMMSVKIPHQHRLPSEMEKYFLSSEPFVFSGTLILNIQANIFQSQHICHMHPYAI